jgi:uncharacterized membrane protein YedE/YeeE
VIVLGGMVLVTLSSTCSALMLCGLMLCGLMLCSLMLCSTLRMPLTLFVVYVLYVVYVQTCIMFRRRELAQQNRNAMVLPSQRKPAG